MFQIYEDFKGLIWTLTIFFSIVTVLVWWENTHWADKYTLYPLGLAKVVDIEVHIPDRAINQLEVEVQKDIDRTLHDRTPSEQNKRDAEIERGEGWVS